MVGICERIKEARTALGLSQEKFATMANLKKRGIQEIEAGHIPRENTIVSICNAHHISRVWLDDGTGPMILEIETADEMIDEKLAHGSEFSKALLRVLARMSDDDLAVVEKMFTALQHELAGAQEKPGD